MARSTSSAPTFSDEMSAPDRWLLEEEDVPETSLHSRIIALVVSILTAWIARTGRDAQVDRNLAVRWDPTRPRTGADPDVVLMQPAPPEGRALTTLDLWEPGHAPPRLAVEIVSLNTADKDYLDAPDRYAASGIEELWIFDPKGFGPAVPEGPFRLQVWRRSGEGELERVYEGDGPAFSPELHAWLVVTEGGEMLRLADDPEGTRLWLTGEEEQAAARDRAERDRDRAERDRDRAERDRDRAERDRDQERLAREQAERDRDVNERALRQRIEELERLLAERGAR